MQKILKIAKEERENTKMRSMRDIAIDGVNGVL